MKNNIHTGGGRGNHGLRISFLQHKGGAQSEEALQKGQDR